MGAPLGLEGEARQYSDIESFESTPIKPLVIDLGGYFCPLEWKDVSKPEEPNAVFIAYYDPRLENHCKGGASEIANRLIYLGLISNKDILMVTPTSRKSTKLVSDARDKAAMLLKGSHKDVQLMTFLRDEIDSESIAGKKETSGSFSIEYSPITAEGEARVMALSGEEMDGLISFIKKGYLVVATDDVYSSGETVEAMAKVVKEAYRRVGMEREYEHPPVVTVMRECDRLDNGELDITELDFPFYTAAITPVILKPKSL